MLAVALAARAPHKVARLVTLAANCRFVAAADYPTAMPPAINQQFNRQFADDPQSALKLFSALQAQGDAQERALLKTLRSIGRSQPNGNWATALSLLASIDNRAAFSQLTQPGLHIFGATDALVPQAAALVIQNLNPAQHIEILSATAHALHWSQPEKIAALLREFLTPSLDKRKVAQSFSRAAVSYDAVAGLQRDVGMALLQKIPRGHAARHVLDLGCGTAFFTARLAQQWPHAQLVGLDIAEGMLHVARTRTEFGASSNPVYWLCADAEYLPLQSARFELVFSSLAIQWCDNLPALFAEVRRVLKPGATFVFTTLGPRTLFELKQAWQTVDAYVHVNRFQSAPHIQTALAVAGFTLDSWTAEERVLRFGRLSDLTRELKALGAHNVNAGQATGLTGRRKLEALKSAYESFRKDGTLPATYEVFYGVARA